MLGLDKKKLQLFVVSVCLVICGKSACAQDGDKWDFSDKRKWDFSDYTRGKGLVIRPELYNGLFATIGCQINPYVQLSVGVGGGFDWGVLDWGFFSTLGIRAYTNNRPWSAMFDYHFGAGFFIPNIDFLMRHTIVAGASYKNLDFGAGLLVATYNGDIGLGLSVTVGYNFRIHKHYSKVKEKEKERTDEKWKF